MDNISYSNARELIQDGDIVFVRAEAQSVVSRIVAFWTRGEYTHVGIAFWMSLSDSDSRLMIVESQRFTKRRIVNLSYYSNCDLVVIESPRTWELYVDDAFSQLGKAGYSWLDAVHVGLQEYFKEWTNTIIPHFGGEFCSEFVARMLKLPEHFISPQRLYNELSAIHKIRCIAERD